MSTKEVQYLNVIKAMCDQGLDDPRVLRRLIDRWAGHSGLHSRKGPQGGISSLSIPKGVRFSDLKPQKKKIVKSADFISASAQKFIEANEGFVTLDHSVPVRCLSRRMLAEKIHTISQLSDFLGTYYRIGLVTVEENKLLMRLGLESEMPNPNWFSQNVFDRYSAAGIVEAKA